jgi:hypothetical protein
MQGHGPKALREGREMAEMAQEGQKRGGEGMGAKKKVKLGCKAEAEKEKAQSGTSGSQADPIVIE